MDEDKELELTLLHPIKWGADTIEKLSFQPIKGKHLKGIKFPPERVDEVFKIASRLTLQPEGVFDEMSAKDVMRLTDKVGNLF